MEENIKKRNPIEIGLSGHLFWDVDSSGLEMMKNASLIIKRVLEYGLLEDWKIIHEYYGLEFIAHTTTGFRELEPRATHFIAHLSGIPLTQFRCYTTEQSKNPHWNF